MNDLDEYIGKRKKKSPAFAADFEKGYKDFKIGVLLKMAREKERQGSPKNRWQKN